MSRRYEAVIVMAYPWSEDTSNIVFSCWWRWLATLTCFTYEIGPALMPLAGGAVVIDTYVKEVVL